MQKRKPESEPVGVVVEMTVQVLVTSTTSVCKAFRETGEAFTYNAKEGRHWRIIDLKGKQIKAKDFAKYGIKQEGTK